MLTDDRALRREVNRLQQTCLRTVEVILLMKDQGLVPEVKAVFDPMQQSQLGIAPAVYEQVLCLAGEWPAPTPDPKKREDDGLLPFFEGGDRRAESDSGAGASI